MHSCYFDSEITVPSAVLDKVFALIQCSVNRIDGAQ